MLWNLFSLVREFCLLVISVADRTFILSTYSYRRDCVKRSISKSNRYISLLGVTVHFRVSEVYPTESPAHPTLGVRGLRRAG